MKRFVLKNMGCKANQLEGAIIAEKMVNAGFVEVQKVEDADIFILNSCTVTHKSDKEALYTIKQMKRKNPTVRTVLTGCYAQVEREELLKDSDIDVVLGNDEKLDIVSHLEKSEVRDIMSVESFHRVLLHNTAKTRANLKIQDGCNNRCAYCIIPFARGKNRSADIDFILEQIGLYEQAGFKEIVLTGIHIGQWGYDLAGGLRLFDLLEAIEQRSSILRYRLGSLNPLEIDDKMIDFLKSSDKFCPHFHLSLQSLCDETLKRMNRGYSANAAVELIEKLSLTFENAFLGCDIIAGFVGETEAEFEETIERLRKTKLSKIHTFPYSVRKGTVAEALAGHVSDSEKSRRADVIKAISEEKYQTFLKSNIGTTHELLIEKKNDKTTGLLKGMTKNYIEVLIDSKDETLKNTIVEAKLFEKSGKIFWK
ncbi:tRNA (N(6)-L-threonylcarbamoyladenosine(37)-C(2))-methylthiotransferase MtaB [bacterium]|nr:tRNA (N(6)-L-threonylcarbamoyladenosine(37)-C(2))-methylthiotransferase MtaB [bacterium]